MRYLILLVTLLSIVSCKGGGGSSGAPAATSDVARLNETFVDSSVTAFSYTSGSVLNRGINNMIEFALPSANAAVNSAYSCVVGSSVDFSLTALTNNVDVTVTCNNQIAVDLAIRVALIESLDGNSLSRSIGSIVYKGGALDLTGGFTWGATYYVVNVYKADNGGTAFADPANPGDTLRPCYTSYKFNKTTRVVTMNNSRLVSEGQNGGGNTADFCTNGGQTTASFRFINGYMEMDLTTSEDFNSANSTYEKWEI